MNDQTTQLMVNIGAGPDVEELAELTQHYGKSSWNGCRDG